MALVWRWKNTDRGSEIIDGAMLKMPVLGDILAEVSGGQLRAHAFDAAGGGLPLVPSLETAARFDEQPAHSQRHHGSAMRVREGQTLAGSLEQQKMFPPLSVEMIEVGESTGALPAMLNSVAEFYEEDVQTALGAAMALIEPVILIIMAVFVGGVLISLYLPIFSLGSGIH